MRSTIISLFCGISAGYALARLRLKGAGTTFIFDHANKAVPVGVVSELIRGDVFSWGELMSGALLGSIPVALIYSFFVEHYVAGMAGAVKGSIIRSVISVDYDALSFCRQ